ncbi:MAG: hypothetical protein ACKOBQ_06575 [Bacteroidota bacterium]
MKNLLLPLAALYALLAASSAAVVTPLGYACYGTGILWIAVTGVTQFFFAFALERRTPKLFVWVVLGGGFLRMLLAAATVILPMSIAQSDGFRSDSLQFAAVFMLAQAGETWLAVRHIKSS